MPQWGRGWEWDACIPSSLSCTDCRSRRTLICGTRVHKSVTISGLSVSAKNAAEIWGQNEKKGAAFPFA